MDYLTLFQTIVIDLGRYVYVVLPIGAAVLIVLRWMMRTGNAPTPTPPPSAKVVPPATSYNTQSVDDMLRKIRNRVPGQTPTLKPEIVPPVSAPPEPPRKLTLNEVLSDKLSTALAHSELTMTLDGDYELQPDGELKAALKSGSFQLILGGNGNAKALANKVKVQPLPQKEA